MFLTILNGKLAGEALFLFLLHNTKLFRVRFVAILVRQRVLKNEILQRQQRQNHIAAKHHEQPNTGKIISYEAERRQLQ